MGMCNLHMNYIGKKKNNEFSQKYVHDLMTYDRFTTIKRYFPVFDNEIFEGMLHQAAKK